MKIYISGKISGLPKDEVIAKFAKAEQEIRRTGHEPVSPLNNGLDWDASYQEHMRADMKMLMDCDAIYMLDDYKESYGAQLEMQVAHRTGIMWLFQNLGNTILGLQKNETL